MIYQPWIRPPGRAPNCVSSRRDGESSIVAKHTYTILLLIRSMCVHGEVEMVRAMHWLSDERWKRMKECTTRKMRAAIRNRPFPRYAHKYLVGVAVPLRSIIRRVSAPQPSTLNLSLSLTCSCAGAGWERWPQMRHVVIAGWPRKVIHYMPADAQVLHDSIHGKVAVAVAQCELNVPCSQDGFLSSFFSSRHNPRPRVGPPATSPGSPWVPFTCCKLGMRRSYAL